MYGINVRLFDRPEMHKHLTNQLKDFSIKPDQLKITPKTFKFFNRGVVMGMAVAHYRHTTDGKVTMKEFAVKNLESL